LDTLSLHDALPISSYQIITDRHKGSLKCFSVLGKGTELMIEIPVKQSGKSGNFKKSSLEIVKG